MSLQLTGKLEKDFTIWQLYAVTHGILSTSMSDVYTILSHITDSDLFSHQLPPALHYVAEKNPAWFASAKAEIDAYIREHGSDFQKLRAYFEPMNRVVSIPQLKDEFDTSDFGAYIIENSLLRNA